MFGSRVCCCSCSQDCYKTNCLGKHNKSGVARGVSVPGSSPNSSLGLLLGFDTTAAMSKQCVLCRVVFCCSLREQYRYAGIQMRVYVTAGADTVTLA